MSGGRFIALEGIEGVGKSTQVALLAERLRVLGKDPVVVREPGGTPFAEEVRQLLLHKPHDLTAASELFLFQAARADLVARVIRPALEAGRIVLSDRFEMTSRTYQSAGRGLPLEQVQTAIALATGGLAPDLYVVLDAPVDVGRSRQAAQGKGPDRLERESAAFHERAAAAYRAVNGPDVAHVASLDTAGATHEAVWRVVTQRFPELAR